MSRNAVGPAPDRNARTWSRSRSGCCWRAIPLRQNSRQEKNKFEKFWREMKLWRTLLGVLSEEKNNLREKNSDGAV
jgi:hypothetical protein